MFYKIIWIAKEVILYGSILVIAIGTLKKETVQIQNNGLAEKLLQEKNAALIRQVKGYKFEIKTLENEVKKDSSFVWSADRAERDSLRALLNP